MYRHYALRMLNVITKRQLTWCLRNNFDHGDFSRFFGRFYDTLEYMGHYWNALEF